MRLRSCWSTHQCSLQWWIPNETRWKNVWCMWYEVSYWKPRSHNASPLCSTFTKADLVFRSGSCNPNRNTRETTLSGSGKVQIFYQSRLILFWPIGILKIYDSQLNHNQVMQKFSSQSPKCTKRMNANLHQTALIKFRRYLLLLLLHYREVEFSLKWSQHHHIGCTETERGSENEKFCLREKFNSWYLYC